MSPLPLPLPLPLPSIVLNLLIEMLAMTIKQTILIR